ncbi:polysaccharide biosynthesis/export family protein [Fimbriiglobus ruber]|uniref:Polysaccharide export protein n=1 Tax=Fimbriiglobus ruber TaxID=1908690 RepID=A0A225E013_9BACT|nr:SLBB domain-containing protein [Fimbriiglobus ruber]OWK46563.1 Polysaccharide export protein [Fimbriiglobus ruber]
MKAFARLLPAAVFLAALSTTGCGSSLGQSFGLSAPQHKLLDEAKQFRAVQPPVAPRELAKSLHNTYIVEAGDVLLVQPVEFDAPIRLGGDQTVFSDGTIDLGKYGRPVVAGKTLPVIQGEIQQIIREKEKAQPKDKADADPMTFAITVRLVNRVSKVYYVLGEVNAPGAFPINGRETVLDAIIAAGGLTRQASEKNIIVSRPTQPDGCRIVFPVCYPQIVQLGDTTTNYQLLPGDRVFVPGRSFTEDLCQSKKKDCPPCNQRQIPCNGPSCGAAGAGYALPGTPDAVPTTAPGVLPVAPAPAPVVGK